MKKFAGTHLNVLSESERGFMRMNISEIPEAPRFFSWLLSREMVRIFHSPDLTSHPGDLAGSEAEPWKLLVVWHISHPLHEG
jgi:hypothetical protein